MLIRRIITNNGRFSENQEEIIVSSNLFRSYVMIRRRNDVAFSKLSSLTSLRQAFARLCWRELIFYIFLNIHIHMVSKTITIKEEAYMALKSLQLEGELFSDTILRISSSFGNLKDFWGAGTKSSKEYKAELAEIEQRRLRFLQGRQ